jgi:hypothetical protein
VIAERVNRYAPHFGIFTGDIIFRDERLHLIAHCFVDRHLARDCGTTSGFSTATSFG